MTTRTKASPKATPLLPDAGEYKALLAIADHQNGVAPEDLGHVCEKTGRGARVRGEEVAAKLQAKGWAGLEIRDPHSIFRRAQLTLTDAGRAVLHQVPAPRHIASAIARLNPAIRSEFAIPAEYAVPRGTDILLLVGPNASGKSLLARYLAQSGKGAVRGMSVSMAMRASAGFGRMVYGLGEEHTATGAASVQGCLALMESARKGHEPFFANFDEPDIGLSDEYALDLAERLADFVTEPLPRRAGAVVTSHGRVFLEAFDCALRTRNAKFEVLMLGLSDAERAAMPQTIAGWVGRPIERRDIGSLTDTNIERFRRIAAILDERKRAP